MERKVPSHNQFRFSLSSTLEEEVLFDSEFDSGNCARVDQVGPYSLHLFSILSLLQTIVKELHSKAILKAGFILPFLVSQIPGLSSSQKIFKCSGQWFSNFTMNNYFKAKQPELYRPAVKIDDFPWKRLDSTVQIQTKENEIEVHFEQEFQNPNQKIFFAFSYPFSYQDLQAKLQKYQELLKSNKNIYFNRETLIKSPQGRNIDLLVISSYDGILNEKEAIINENLFPEGINSRPWKYYFIEIYNFHRYRQNKPIIFLSARVHPGEAPGSHALNGAIDFLLSRLVLLLVMTLVLSISENFLSFTQFLC